MSIYKPFPDERSQLAHPVDAADFETVNSLVNGDSRSEAWSPPAFQLINEDEGASLVPVDLPWLGSHSLVFKPRALLALRASLEPFGEFLPVDCSDSKLWLFNPRVVLPALDFSAAGVTRFANGRIMRVARYAFLPDVVASCDVFKISELRVSPTFFSGRIVELFREHELTGISFREIWGAEPDAA